MSKLRLIAFSFRARLRRGLKQPEQECITAPVVIAFQPCQCISTFTTHSPHKTLKNLGNKVSTPGRRRGPGCQKRGQTLESLTHAPLHATPISAKQLTPAWPVRPLPKGAGHYPNYPARTRGPNLVCAALQLPICASNAPEQTIPTNLPIWQE